MEIYAGGLNIYFCFANYAKYQTFESVFNKTNCLSEIIFYLLGLIFSTAKNDEEILQNKTLTFLKTLNDGYQGQTEAKPINN